MPKFISVSEQLAAFIFAYPEKLREIARQTGVDNGNLSKFVAGKRSLSQQSIDKLCAFLGLELRSREKVDNQKKGK